MQKLVVRCCSPLIVIAIMWEHGGVMSAKRGSSPPNPNSVGLSRLTGAARQQPSAEAISPRVIWRGKGWHALHPHHLFPQRPQADARREAAPEKAVLPRMGLTESQEILLDLVHRTSALRTFSPRRRSVFNWFFAYEAVWQSCNPPLSQGAISLFCWPDKTAEGKCPLLHWQPPWRALFCATWLLKLPKCSVNLPRSCSPLLSSSSSPSGQSSSSQSGPAWIFFSFSAQVMGYVSDMPLQGSCTWQVPNLCMARGTRYALTLFAGFRL